jgi:nanoRNase/pAp phosphatase (c-di-AMP/oligoRNAs hydrolase)
MVSVTKSTKFGELEAKLKQYALEHKGKIAIEIQRVPDPDALSSAYFLQLLAKSHGMRSDVTHCGLISHTSNRMLVKGLDMKTVLHNQTQPQNYAGFMFADHSGGTSPWYLNGKIPDERLIAIVDHHELDKPVSSKVSFVDRRHVGATATIITEYLKQGGVAQLEQRFSTELPRLYSALAYGIMTDVGESFELATPNDETALAYLQKHMDKSFLKEIKSPPIPTNWYNLQAKAYNSRVTQDKETIAFLGILDQTDRDVIPITADQLLREVGVHTVYAIGIVNDATYGSMIDVSIRTKKANFEYPKATARFEGAVGGGRNGAGGIQAPNPFDVDERTLIPSHVREKLHYERILKSFHFPIPNNLDVLFAPGNCLD